MHAHPVRILLPYVPFAMAASTCARCFPPFPFIVLCVRRLVASALQMPTGAACGVGLKRGRAFASALAAAGVFVLGVGAARRPRVPGVICIILAWQAAALVCVL